MTEAEYDAVIIGAGIAGLSVASRLCSSGYRVIVLEKDDTIGGRIKSDFREGFLLDHGFQVFLPAYPEAQAILNYPALDLAPIPSKALIRYRDSFFNVGDPLKHPEIFRSLFSLPVMGLKDFGAAIKLRASLALTPNRSLSDSSQTTSSFLNRLGFSESIQTYIIRPFLRGVFLDPELITPCNQARFILKMFADAGVALPRGGMRSIADNLFNQIPAETVRLNTEVVNLDDSCATAKDGSTYKFKTAIICDAGTSRRLANLTTVPSFFSCTTFYFSADSGAFPDYLVLNPLAGENECNHLLVPSKLVPTYAPTGKQLISATSLNVTSEQTAIYEISKQILQWFKGVTGLDHLATYPIRYALPFYANPADKPKMRTSKPNIFLAGDFLKDGSINGSLMSGREVASAVSQYLSAQ